MTRPEDLLYAVDDMPPWPRLLFLGMQHAMLLSVNLVLIVIVFRRAGAGDAAILSALSLGMIALAISTVLQSLPKGSGRLGIPGAAHLFGDLYRARCAGGQHRRASGRVRDDYVRGPGRDRLVPAIAQASSLVPPGDQRAHRRDRRPSARCNRDRRLS